jgi:hypothetical protein
MKQPITIPTEIIVTAPAQSFDQTDITFDTSSLTFDQV